MSLILAIEPDAVQAEVLSRVLPERTGTGVDLVMAESIDAAFNSLNGRMPDILLLGRDLTSEEQDAVVARLAARGDTSAVHRLTIPELRLEDEEPRRSSWRLPFGRQRPAGGEGWDPVLFVEQITSHIEQRERELARAGLRVVSASRAVAERYAAATPHEDYAALIPSGEPAIDAAAEHLGEPEDTVPLEAAEPHAASPGSDAHLVFEPARVDDAGADDTWRGKAESATTDASVWQPVEDEPTRPLESEQDAPFSEPLQVDDRADDDWTLPAVDAVLSHDEWTASRASGDRSEEAGALSDERAFVAQRSDTSSGDTFEWSGTRVADPQPPWQSPTHEAAMEHDAVSDIVPGHSPVDDAFEWAVTGGEDRSDPQDDSWIRRALGETDAVEFESHSRQSDVDAASVERTSDESAEDVDISLDADPADPAPTAVPPVDATEAELFESMEVAPFETVETLDDDAPRSAFGEEADQADQADLAGLADLSETSDEVSIDLSEDVFDPRLFDPGAATSTAGRAASGRGAARATAGTPAGSAHTSGETGSHWPEEGLIDAEVHAAELALAEVRAEERLASEVQRVRAEAAVQHAEELARLESRAAAARDEAVIEARAAAEADARAALAAELSTLRGEAEQKLASELARVRAEAAQNLTEQIGRTRAEADHVLETELARAQAQAEAVRAAACEEARQAAETTAARATAAEVERARADAEARLEAELARVRAEAERERRAHEQKERDAEILREQAARDAREEAEAAAARTLEAEVERVKAEADARLTSELERMQQQAEEHWFGPRSAPDAAARALDAEMAQARAEAAAQLQAELTQLRAEAAEARRVRVEADRQAEAQRGAAAREAREAAERAVQRTVDDESARVREAAEARLAAETARVRAEAEERLAAELAAFSAEAERRRQDEIRQIRSQMARMRDSLYENQLSEEMVVGGGGYVGQAPLARRTPRRNWLLESTWPRHAAIVAVIVAVTSFVVDVPAMLRATIGRARGAFVASDAARSAEPSEAPDAREPAPYQDPVVPSPPPRRPVAASPPRTPEPRRTTAVSGTLTVSSRIPLDVYVDNRRIGTSDGPILLAPGWHTLRLVSNRFNYREEIAVEIRPGDAIAHTVTLPMGQVRVRSTAGAEVWVEGDLVGHAPVVEVEVPIGTREVVVRHPELGVRRAAVEVRHGLWSDVILSLERQADGPPAAPQLPPLSRQPAPRPAR